MDAEETPAPETCEAGTVTRAQELIDNIPYLFMLLLGAVIFWISLPGTLWPWLAAGLYAAYGVVGAAWIMYFVCPYCDFYDTRLCPCGYGRMAAKLRGRADAERFAGQFRKHIPVIVPLWFAPLIAGGFPLVRQFSWGLLVLLLAFAINSFTILPLVSRKYGCARCPQKETCPWMGNCKRAA